MKTFYAKFLSVHIFQQSKIFRTLKVHLVTEKIQKHHEKKLKPSRAIAFKYLLRERIKYVSALINNTSVKITLIDVRVYILRQLGTTLFTAANPRIN